MLRNLNIKEEYYTGESDLVEEFYKPCLENSYRYDRSVGFFRSSVFILIGPELIKFALRGGKVRLICSPSLADNDLKAISEGYETRGDLEDALSKDIEALISNTEVTKNTEALATLIKCDVLEVRIAFLPEAKGEYHTKLGLLKDEYGNSVSFKGSVNESWTGWHERGNHETLDVFVSWEPGRDERQVQRNSSYFDNLWADNIPKLKVVPFPEVCKKQLESVAKKSVEDIDPDELVDYFKVNLPSSAKEEASSKNPATSRKPFPHQEAALNSWMNQGFRGILEHATGSGKTFTALLALKEHLEGGGVGLVLVPDRLLHKQWTEELQTELPDFIVLKCGDGNNTWRKNSRLHKFTRPVPGISGRVVLTTMPTARTEEFRNSICGGEHLFVIADEVHEVGSTENSMALLIESGKRLGLSATPRRYNDPIGTQKIFEYFGKVVEPPFTLADAIKSGRLVNYEYHPQPIYLTPEESEKWESESKKIVKEYARAKRDADGNTVLSPYLQNLIIQRARIAKKASAKVPYAIRVIEKEYHDGESWLIYCEDQSQLNEVIAGLRKKGFSPCEYHTNMKGDQLSSLEWYKKFGGIMVSIRCLDQGVDIPKISHAIILASSQNPRQFIQRRGRVLRINPGKYKAVIHDAVVVPFNLESEPGQLSLLKSELQRSIQFSSDAINSSGANTLISIAIDLGVNPEENSLLNTDGIEDLKEKEDE